VTLPQRPPRNLTSEPEAFGRAASIGWIAADGRDEIDVVAARLQHEWALRVRAGIRGHGKSVKLLAITAGLSYDRLRKLLSGEAAATLHNIAAVDWAMKAQHSEVLKH
jgi:lambda repressor-like predicted transcriptional regulator